MKILVTRPEPKAKELVDLLREEGFRAESCPLFTILPPENPEAISEALHALTGDELLIFVSPNAVTALPTRLSSNEPVFEVLRRCSVFAIGPGTRHTLQMKFPSCVVSIPKISDSEHLLKLPELQDVSHRRVVIFRGDDGRELLGQTLKARGAELEYVTCYQRVRIQENVLNRLERWRREPFDIVVVTSTESLQELISLMADDLSPLQHAWVTVMGNRMAQVAREAGLYSQLKLEGPSNMDIVETIKRFAYA